MTALDVVVAGLWLLTLGAGVGVVTSRNMFHAALYLVFALMGVAGLMLSLGADVVAFLHLLIYVGGIMTLLLFAIMLIRRLGDRQIRQTNQGWPLGLLVAGVFVALIASVVPAAMWATRGDPREVHMASQLQALALRFLSDYLLVFEGASLLLLIALVGAIVLAREDVDEDNLEDVL